MTSQEDEILTKELGKLAYNTGKASAPIIGAVTGGLPGAIAGVVTAGITGKGAQLGTQFVAKLLPNDVDVLSIEVNSNSQKVVQSVFNILKQQGQIVENINPSQCPTFSLVIGSGALNMNPALVTVEIVPVSETITKVSIKGTAKEGLIKQHAGQKAAIQIRDFISQAFQSPVGG